MAQMPIQSLSGRAEPYAAARPAALPNQIGAAIPRATYIHDPGGISGGLLRPGSIDQELFKAHLAAARKAAVLAPPTTGAAARFSGIPSLSPAQLAPLGAVEAPGPGELVIDVPAPTPPDLGKGGADQPRPGQAGGIVAVPVAAPVPPAMPGAPARGAASSEAAPVATDASPNAASASEARTSAPAAPIAQAPVERGPIPGSRRGADGVWELTRLPDKDERDLLRGQKWRVVESEAARRLFLGPDGEFGWDDFVDLINPLQHIPLVNLAYRAVTGDEIYGAARMVDMAFGPLAATSTVVDLAFRDVTGEGVAGNAVAALFGPEGSTVGEPAGGGVSVNTASAMPHPAAAGLIRRGSNK